MDRSYLKFFDKTKPSKFNGKPGGFNELTSENPIIDMHPDVFNIHYPVESKIPL